MDVQQRIIFLAFRFCESVDSQVNDSIFTDFYNGYNIYYYWRAT